MKRSLKADHFNSDDRAYVIDLGEYRIGGMDGGCSAMKTNQNKSNQAISSIVAVNDVGSSESGGGGKVFCYNNHGGKNCTALGFHGASSCTLLSPQKCMDYNGYFTDCSGSKTYFAGGDCDYALGAGYC